MNKIKAIQNKINVRLKIIDPSWLKYSVIAQQISFLDFSKLDVEVSIDFLNEEELHLFPSLIRSLKLNIKVFEEDS